MLLQCSTACCKVLLSPTLAGASEDEIMLWGLTLLKSNQDG